MSLENFPSAGVQGMLQGQLQSTESGQLSRVSEDDDHCRFFILYDHVWPCIVKLRSSYTIKFPL